MHRHIGKFIATLLIGGLVAIVFILNGHDIIVHPWFGAERVMSAAIVILTSFIAGAGLASSIAVVIGIRAAIRERSLKKQLIQQKKHWDMIVRAREFLASRESGQAIILLQKIIDKEPENIVARIELAQAFTDSGDSESALSVLDAARQEHKSNIELLFFSAALNEKLGNQTAAFDNLSLILKISPTHEETLSQLVRLARQLGRLEQAKSLQIELTRNRRTPSEIDETARIDIELELAEKQAADDKSALRDELEKIVRRNKKYAPAILKLACLEEELGQLDNASESYGKSFRESGNHLALERLASLWLKQERPEKAVAAIRSALNSWEKSSARENIMGRLTLASVLLALENVAEAASTIKDISTSSMTDKEQTICHIIKARIAERRGDSRGALGELAILAESSPLVSNSEFAKCILPHLSNKPVATFHEEGPSPELSTP
ncbi:MAG: hypothetical protein PHC51_10885 [bacterium]|nr:hypothetical protein [bacterium]